MKDIQKTRPNYYAIIPAEIRYHKELKPNEKLLYGEITALCDKNGTCWASNQYFANLYGVDVCTVSRWILHLKELGFINYEISKKEGNKRYISLLIKKSILIDLKVNSYRQKSQDPIDLKVNSYNKDEQSQTNINNEQSKLTKQNPLKNPSEILELDLKIAEQKQFLAKQVIGDGKQRGIFHFDGKEITTFSRAFTFMAEQCQAGKLHISIFKDAVEWARSARASNANNKKGLFMAKLKEQTGYKPAGRLLRA
jgi:hypothetical protein